MGKNCQRSMIVCPCHDVTLADIEHVIAEGHTDPETIKRATAVYMGACQGKFCSPIVQQLLAERGIEPVGQQRRPSARLPIIPVPLGSLIDDPTLDSSAPAGPGADSAAEVAN